MITNKTTDVKQSAMYKAFEEIIHLHAGSNNYDFEGATRACTLKCIDKIRESHRVVFMNIGLTDEQLSELTTPDNYLKEFREEVEKI